MQSIRHLHHRPPGALQHTRGGAPRPARWGAQSSVAAAARTAAPALARRGGLRAAPPAPSPARLAPPARARAYPMPAAAAGGQGETAVGGAAAEEAEADAVLLGELNLDADKLRVLMSDFGVAAGPVSLGLGSRGRGIFLPEGTPREQVPGSLGTDVAAFMGEELLLGVPQNLLLYASTEEPCTFTPEAAASPALSAILEGPKIDSKLKLASLLLWATSPLAPEGDAEEVGDAARRLWRRYLEFLPLPEQQRTLVAFSPEEAAGLQDAEMAGEVGANEAGIDKWHAALGSYWEGTEMEGVLGATPERLRWALATVSERALLLNVGPGPAAPLCIVLAPFVDMLNHAPSGGPDCGASVKSINKGDPFSQNLPIPEGVFVTHKRGASEGSEACFAYLSGAESSNGRLMRSFGFILEGNEWDAVDLKAASPIEGSILQKMFRVAAPGGGPGAAPSKLLSVLPLAPPPEGGRRPPAEHASPAAAMAEAKAVASLVGQCEKALKGFASTPEIDALELASLSGADAAGGRRAVAVQARAARRGLYERVLEELVTYRDAMPPPPK